VFAYRDHVGNNIHHFDIPGQHSYLVIVAESLLEVQPALDFPPSLPPDAWAEADTMVQMGDFWEMLLPSEFAEPTPLLLALAGQLGVCRRDDPLTLLRELNQRLYEYFDYVPKSTKVDSPIDHAIESRQGVCQDFAHIMIALVRNLRIPCRYVSGYLYRRAQDHDRSVVDATHAWVEAFLPPLGWVGFDPTNCLLAGDRHIRTAIGRDYSDVPPTRGIFRGHTASDLSVAVRVTASAEAPELDQVLPVPEEWSVLVEQAQEPPPPPVKNMAQEQQQQ
jgi:transglutaminase-like putative cysteine protease